MIENDLLKIADDRIRLEFEADDSRLAIDIERALVLAASRGMGGGLIAEAARICAKAAEDRADLAWRILYRTITAGRIAYSSPLNDELRTAVATHLRTDGLKARVADIAGRMGSPNTQAIVQQVSAKIDTAASLGLNRTFNEIALFVASLKSLPDAASAGGPTFNVYAPVGAILTGHNSSAAVVQNIDAGTKRDLDEKLNQLQRAVEGARGLNAPATEIAELVSDARKELAKTQPNQSKLRSLLSTAGDVVRIAGDLRPAYEAVKSGFAAIGIDLP